MCVGSSARGSVWKMLKVREGHCPWSCHADCQTDSAPTTVTIRSWHRSSVLDTMYRSLRTFLPLWHKGLARVRTCKLPNNAHLVKAISLVYTIYSIIISIIWCIEPQSAFGWKNYHVLFSSFLEQSCKPYILSNHDMLVYLSCCLESSHEFTLGQRGKTMKSWSSNSHRL